MKRIGGGWSVAGAALTGADEEVGQDWVVLDEFKGETAEVIARGSREVSCCGDDWACVHGDVLTAWAWRDGVADVAGVHGGAESRVVGRGWSGRSGEGSGWWSGRYGIDADHVPLGGEFPEFFLEEDGGCFGGVLAVEPADTQLLKKITDRLRHRQGDLHCVYVVLEACHYFPRIPG